MVRRCGSDPLLPHVRCGLLPRLLVRLLSQPRPAPLLPGPAPLPLRPHRLHSVAARLLERKEACPHCAANGSCDGVDNVSPVLGRRDHPPSLGRPAASSTHTRAVPHPHISRGPSTGVAYAQRHVGEPTLQHHLPLHGLPGRPARCRIAAVSSSPLQRRSRPHLAWLRSLPQRAAACHLSRRPLRPCRRWRTPCRGERARGWSPASSHASSRCITRRVQRRRGL
mmetsp:Transcript_16071/g.51548  ORF Transcript_16071/g.51548 Transcript_16071/m.51548 type:complete len:224 (-) Transcript_16071:686-1357(-)